MDGKMSCANKNFNVFITNENILLQEEYKYNLVKFRLSTRYTILQFQEDQQNSPSTTMRQQYAKQRRRLQIR